MDKLSLKIAYDSLSFTFDGTNLQHETVYQYKEQLFYWYKLNKVAFDTEISMVNTIIRKSFVNKAQIEFIKYQETHEQIQTVDELISYFMDKYGDKKHYVKIRKCFIKIFENTCFH